MKEVFYVSFFIYRKHGWKKKSRQNKSLKKRNVYLQKVMIFLIHFFLFFRRS